MENVKWDEKYKIGVEQVDNAHIRLFRIMERLVDVSQNTKNNQNTYKEGIKYLEAYTMTHFSEEEAYMRSIQYNGYARHKRIHDNFRDKTLVSLKRDLELSDYSLISIQRFVGIMNQWLVEHIMREDQAIVGKAGFQKGFDLSSRLPVIIKNVNRAMTDVFQMEAKLVSTEYKGESIGKGFYCWRLYGMEDGIRVQMLLGVEELLFLRGTNRMPGTQTAKKEEITAENALLIFDQLFRNMSKMFKVETDYRFGKNNLLTEEAFRENFMKGYPCSLLFNSKSGNLIFCYRSWRIRK